MNHNKNTNLLIFCNITNSPLKFCLHLNTEIKIEIVEFVKDFSYNIFLMVFGVVADDAVLSPIYR